MRTGTIVSLGASAVLGLGALIVARVWLPQTAHLPQIKTEAAPMANTVPVVVASSAIPYGAKLDAAHLMVERLPAGSAPQGAYATPAQILSQTGGAPVALTPIAAREPLLPSKLSGPGARPIVSAVIGEGMRAYTIGVSDTGGVGGHALPGDRVDVIVTRQPPVPKALKDLCDDCKRERADVVLQNVRVIGMDLNVDPSTTTSVLAHTATLEVSVLDAQKLAVATQVGVLSLALRRVGSAEITPVREVEIGDLRSTAPRAPGPPSLDDMKLPTAPRQATPGQRAGHTRTIIVVHGDASSNVEVPAERWGRGA
ncbi:MAG TPA: Flp pilus assembly protein CpaB [Caulobacteraceae bacterium]|nr:Flp pilus assembly protein CpaB [Caulobacteraceae bacterium]